jgi:hypothetical protein
VASEKPGGVPAEYRAQARFPVGKPTWAALVKLDGCSGALEPLVPLEHRVSRAGDRVAGRLAFPAAPHDLRAFGARDLRGISVTSVSHGRSRGKATLVTLPSPSERSRERWDRLALVPPLVGLGALLPMYLPCVHSGKPKLPSDRRRQVPIMFRPRGFAPPRRFAPHGSCGFVAPRNRLGVRRVSCMPTGESPESGSRCRGQSPRCESNPSKSSLVSSRKRITATVAFLSLPSCPAGDPAETGSAPTASPLTRGAYTRGDSLG